MRGPVGSLAAPEKTDEYEVLDTGVAGVAVYLHRDLAAGGSEVEFEFGLLGRCRVMLD